MSNEKELIELSKRVAKKLGIAASIDRYESEFWLYENSELCFELMCKHKLVIQPTQSEIYSGWVVKVMLASREFDGVCEHAIDYRVDSTLTTRVAILKALED